MRRAPRIPAVLFVHDGPRERTTLHLLKTAFTVTETDDIREAKTLIELDTPFDCVVSDISQSAQERSRFVQWLDATKPDLVRRTVVVGKVPVAAGASLPAPYLAHDLIETINRVLSFQL